MYNSPLLISLEISVENNNNNEFVKAFEALVHWNVQQTPPYIEFRVPFEYRVFRVPTVSNPNLPTVHNKRTK
jgi:hypothetical protein